MKHINSSVYFLCTWLFSIYLCTGFLHNFSSDGLRDQIHILLLLLTYGLMYQSPAIVGYWLLRRWPRIAISVAILFAILGHLFVFFDSRLYDLYAFHINGFVWNLLTTPGGIDSLGADQTNVLLIFSYIGILAGVHIVSLTLAAKMPRPHLPATLVVALFLVATLSERVVYGYSYAELYGPVLAHGDAMPLYQPMKMNTLLSRLGIKVKKTSKIEIDQGSTRLDYPKHAIELSRVDKPMNIIMLISESMRWDLLTPAIMPNMSRFADKAWNFTHHYSGGNGTRQGLFALFYGIPGNNWDLFLRNQHGPVLFDVLNDYNYQYFLYTSAKFTYPELDRTIFSAIPKEKLIENDEGEPWVRDEANTTALINSIKNRNPNQPFFGFLFYEATHARYSFPDSAIINKDYTKSLDYAGLSREQLAPQIKGMLARYENAAHGIDMQLQRLISHLEKSGDLENTMVIITGDHGEEFMERGRWGHNSAFTDWQVRVPMIVWMPDTPAKTISQRTSHLDVQPTILTRLGVKNPVKDYSLGQDLSSPEDHRNILVSSWSDLGLITDEGKLVIPFKSTTQHDNLATDINDNPVNGSDLVARMQSTVFKVLNDVRYYSR